MEEIRELPAKLKPQLGVTAERVEGLIQDLAKYARPVDNVPPLYTHPFDLDDSHYINLALVIQARLIVSRDRHLLNLMDTGRNEGKDFKERFPDLFITTPDVLAVQLKASIPKDET